MLLSNAFNISLLSLAILRTIKKYIFFRRRLLSAMILYKIWDLGLDNYYKASNIEDIEQFIQNVINDVDPLKEQRTNFVNEVLMPKGSPSQNIINDILDSIDNQILYRY